MANNLLFASRIVLKISYDLEAGGYQALTHGLLISSKKMMQRYGSVVAMKRSGIAI